MTTTLRAYHDNPTIKATYLARVRSHAAADEITQGIYWQDGKGCAVGCTIHGGDHARYETEIGVPAVLAHLEDRLFELMAPADAKGWPLAFLDAIPVGADLSLVWPRFVVWMLTDPTDGVIRHSTTEDQRRAVGRVADLYARLVAGGIVLRAEWEAAYAAASSSAASYAAYAYASSAAAYAAAAAADAADDAADAADDAADAYAGGSREWARRAAGHLTSLLAAAPTSL